MALDDTQSAAEIEALRLRVDRLEREVAALRNESAVPLPPAVEPVVILAHTIPPPPPPPILSTPPASVSLEDRLGSQIFNRIAIAALLIGTAYFLKLAIDNQWIGPLGRALVGLLAGAGLILWSERFRRQGVRAFSYSLKAVGSGVLYLSIWAAFQLYHLLPASAALALMVLVTAWNAFMAWTQDAELLAAYALIGGFATPLLLSTGGDHEVFLFTYLLAIDAATVALVRLKGWPRLLLATFPATVSFFIGWYVSWYVAAALSVTAIFLGLFCAIFAAASLGARSRVGKAVPIASILLPLANAAFLALGMYSVLQDAAHHAWLPWTMLALAGVYLGVMRLPQPRVTAAIHLSIAIVFLTVAIPLKASGYWIAVAWLVEGVALFWVLTRLAAPAQDETALREETVLRVLAVATLALALIAIVAAPYWYTDVLREDLFNHDLATALLGVAAFAAVAWLALRTKQRANAATARVAMIVVNLLALLLSLREIAVTRYDRMVRTAFFHADFAAALIGIAVLGAAAYVAWRIASREEERAWGPLGAGSLIAMNLVAVLSGVREIASFWRSGVKDPSDGLKEALAISGFLMVYSALLLAAGFWKRTALVRWQGLVLVVFTIAKTFLYDIGSLSQGYRVVSFLGLGALLMGVSFVYQKDWLSLREPGPPPTEAGP